MVQPPRIDEFFAAARNEQHPSPIRNAEDLRALSQRRKVSTWRVFPFAMLGIVLVGAVASWLVLGDSPTVSNPTSSQGMTVAVGSHSIQVGSSTLPPAQLALADTVESADHVTLRATYRRNLGSQELALTEHPVTMHTLASVASMLPDKHMLMDNDEIHVAALVANDAFYRSLRIEPAALTEICRNLAGADSVTNCSMGSYDQQTKVCVYKNGATDEVVFMDGPGPMPVMFTSANGRGRVVTSRYSSNVDPNRLVPVAAHGCGDNVLMWFAPTEEFVYSLPDSLSKDLNHVLEFEMQMRADGKNLRIKSRINHADSLSSIDEVFCLDSLLGTKSKMMDSVRKHFDAKIRELSSHGQVDSLFNKFRSLVPDSLFRNFMLLLDSADVKIEIKTDEQSVRPHRLRDELSTDFEHSIMVIKCGRIDRGVGVPPAALPIQETRLSEGAVSKTSIYPNPTSDGGVTIAFTLQEPRLLSVHLTDLGGAEIRELATNVWKNTGPGQMAFVLSDVPAGMYLVTIVTDRNERVVQRLIVQ